MFPESQHTDGMVQRRPRMYLVLAAELGIVCSPINNSPRQFLADMAMDYSDQHSSSIETSNSKVALNIIDNKN